MVDASAYSSESVMRITRLYVRFFRSFNYDYERKAHPDAQEADWERIDGAWFPFVRVDFDPAVTAVVGANESGKTHLLDALEIAITGKGIHRRDFCRYSRLFSVQTGRRRDPEFGLELAPESAEDLELASDLGLSAKPGDTFAFVRLDGGQAGIVDPESGVRQLVTKDLQALESRLPTTFRLDTEVPIPDTLPLDALAGRERGPLSSRRKRFEVFDALNRPGSPDEVTQRIPALAATLADGGSPRDAEAQASEALGRRLLVEAAGIDPAAFAELEEALREEKEGRASGLIEHMNRLLANRLNVTRWWTQDREFELRLARSERDVAFTIRDRTGTEYSFSERSRGLKYFLSYFVQLKVHSRPADRPELLLMDEPDAYLSSRGQQDLLRVLEEFARPEDGSRADQVVYVTHSPFLINKNAAHRIRVLDKGAEEEGSRVVRDAAKNHYEPLRSSVGSFGAETAFISGSNLIVEGPADQVLIAGLAVLARFRGELASRSLDLNEVTIVAAGGASHVPYMTYLARGRDAIKPACVVLLDGDEAGKEAAAKLARHEMTGGRPLLDGRYVVDLSEWASDSNLRLPERASVVQIEDLIPLEVAVEALRAYARRFMRVPEADVDRLKVALIKAHLADGTGALWPAAEAAFGEAFDGAHVDKVGFAKELTEWVDRVKDGRRPPGLQALEDNFASLLSHLASLLRAAAFDEVERRQLRRLRREIDGFARDRSDGATRDEADRMLRDVEATLEDDEANDLLRRALAGIRRDFRLRSEPSRGVEHFEDFKRRVLELKTLDRMSASGTDLADA